MSNGDEIIESMLNPYICGIFLFFFVPMLFSASRSSGKVPKVLREAPIGRGTITATRTTGLMMNNTPQLEISIRVDALDGSTFNSSLTLFVDPAQLATMQPGITLPVHYLPNDTKKRIAIATDVSAEQAQAALNEIQLVRDEVSSKHFEIGARGIEADAVVMQMSSTGEVKDGKSVLQLTVQITRPDGTSFTVAQERPILSSFVSVVQTGRVLRVKYLPEDETDYVILNKLNS